VRYVDGDYNTPMFCYARAIFYISLYEREGTHFSLAQLSFSLLILVSAAVRVLPAPPRVFVLVLSALDYFILF
jgi:hypothetical protein